MTVDPRHEALGRIAAGQAGAFTLDQALAAGIPVREARWRLHRGEWCVVFRGVLRAATTPVSRELRAAAALLALGTPARFSHFTAARLLALDVRARSDLIDVTTAHGRGNRAPIGVVVRQSRHLPPPATAAGYPVMPLARTVVDLAQVVEVPDLVGVLYDAVRRRVVTVDAILAEAEGMGGRPGLRTLRIAIAEFDPVLESVAEAEAAEHFRRAGMHLVPQLEIWDGPFLIARTDFGDDERQIAIEVDGDVAHSSKFALERDGRRDRRLRRYGWETIRFRASDVRRRPAEMIADIRALQRLVDERTRPRRH
jgi:very-short-patch-repair endonuclease